MFYYLYLLLYKQDTIFSGLRVFRYITVRSVFAAITAFLISIIFGPWIIRRLKAMKANQPIRLNGPESHFKKSGTPTMGGVLIIFSIILSCLFWNNLNNSMVWVVLFVTVWLGLIGFIDDYVKLTQRNSKGLSVSFKLVSQVTLGLLLGFYLYKYPLDIGAFWNYKINSANYMQYLDTKYMTQLAVPFFKNVLWRLSWFYIPFVALVVVGSSNAVNLTDGLDGLAIGAIVFSAISFLGMSYVTGNWTFSQYLNVFYVEGAGELTVICAAIIGAGLGFLWYNTYPAEVFMGDTGSLALGGALGTIAILTKKELTLIIIGGIFVIEAISVIIQVLVFNLTGKKVFAMSPIHHHYEMKGWPEPKVVVRFWIVCIVFTLLTLATLKIR